MHSRERQLEKLQQDMGEKPREPNRTLKIRAGDVKNTGREVLSGRGLEHRFGERVLYRGLDLDLERGERLAIIGPNGAGKTTLLKDLAGIQQATAGSVSYGYRVQPAYFAQDLSALDPEATVFETLWDTGAVDNQQVLQVLHQFLFAGDAVNKQVADLSGGERTRLALCKLLVTKPNLLLLDEPTNHLDIASREAVERALRTYPGAVVVVSHDRYFLEAVATRLLEIRPRGIRHFDGSYARYRETLLPRTTPVARPVAKARASAPPPAAGKPRSASPAKRLPKLEAEIATLEARMTQITELLGDASTWTSDRDPVALSAEYEKLTSQLELLYAEWEEVAELAGAGSR
jgi:ATP-binding cassette subfamily F protein 3